VQEIKPDIVDWLRDYYGIIDSYPFDQLTISSESNKFKRINFISKGIQHLLKSDRRNQLKLVNVGVKLFSLNKQKDAEENPNYCKYRICQDGLIYLLPFMSKRIYFCNEETFKYLLTKKDIKKEEISEEGLKEKLDLVKSGCVILMHLNQKLEDDVKLCSEEYYAHIQKYYNDALCCYISAVRLSTMINKEHQHVFNLKYKLE
jgi:hypothetical protein